MEPKRNYGQTRNNNNKRKPRGGKFVQTKRYVKKELVEEEKIVNHQMEPIVNEKLVEKEISVKNKENMEEKEEEKVEEKVMVKEGEKEEETMEGEGIHDCYLVLTQEGVENSNKNYRVNILNLDDRASPEDMMKVFGKYIGRKINRAFVIKVGDKPTGKGWIEMNSEEDSLYTLAKLDGFKYYEKKINAFLPKKKTFERHVKQLSKKKAKTRNFPTSYGGIK